MPYEWEKGLTTGTWRPEFGVPGWEKRQVVEELIRGRHKVEEFKGKESQILEVLAEDLGSMQRDGLFYYNFLEQVKREGPEAAGRVRERMGQLGMYSASLRPEEGGPPNPTFGKFLNWLLEHLVEVGRRMQAIVLDIMPRLLHQMLAGLAGGVISVSLSVGFPPAVILGYDPVTLRLDMLDWVKRFLDHFYGELQKEAVPA